MHRGWEDSRLWESAQFVGRTWKCDGRIVATSAGASRETSFGGHGVDNQVFENLLRGPLNPGNHSGGFDASKSSSGSWFHTDRVAGCDRHHCRLDLAASAGRSISA